MKWNSSPDGNGQYTLNPGDPWGGDFDITFYAVWEDIAPPKILSKEATFSNISPSGFTITFQAEDNVGIEECWAMVTPTVEPDRKTHVNGTYDASTKTVTIKVSIADIKVLCENYTVNCYVDDAAHDGSVCLSAEYPISVYRIDSSAAGEYKAIRDTNYRAAPQESFNGISLVAAPVEEGTKKKAEGSVVGSNGKNYLKVDRYLWLPAEDMTRVSGIADAWNYITGKITSIFYNLGGRDVYAVSSASESVVLPAKTYSFYKEMLPTIGTGELPEISDRIVIEENEVFSFNVLNGDAGYGVYITEYLGAGGTVEIPTTIGGLPVVAIRDNAFKGRANVNGAAIPNSVKSIGDSAFYGCAGLTNITIPEGVTEIGGSTFYGCTNLTSVQLPNSLKTIGASAFMKTGLTDITIPDGLTTVGNNAFSGIANVWCHAGTSASRQVSANSSPYCFVSPSAPSYRMKEAEENGVYTLTVVKYISEDAEADVPSSVDGIIVTKIGDEAFRGDRYYDSYASSYVTPPILTLTGVKLPGSVVSIGTSAFNGCANLTNVKLQNGLQTIGDSSFYGCAGLPGIVIPEGVAEIGSNHSKTVET